MKLIIPKLKETAKIGAVIGGMTAVNFLVLKAVKSNVVSAPVAGIGLATGYPLAAYFIGKKRPMLGAALFGASMSLTLTALAAYLTGDFSLMAFNPTQIASLKGLSENSDMAGLPENLFYMNTRQ